MDKELLNVAQLADTLKVSTSKIYKDISLGLPHYKVGSKLRFYLDEVLDYYKKVRID